VVWTLASLALSLAREERQAWQADPLVCAVGAGGEAGKAGVGWRSKSPARQARESPAGQGVDGSQASGGAGSQASGGAGGGGLDTRVVSSFSCKRREGRRGRLARKCGAALGRGGGREGRG